MADDACELFKALDKNKDGGISAEEFSQGYRSGIIVRGPAAQESSAGIIVGGPAAQESSAGIIVRGPAAQESSAESAQPGIQRAPTESALKLAEASLAAALAIQQGSMTQSEATAMVTDAAVEVAVAKAARVAAEQQVSEDDVNPKFRKAFAEAEERLAAAQRAHAKLKADGQVLQKENEELKQAVGKARVNAERRILRKRADNVQLLADNAELEHFTSEARMLSEQKLKLMPSKTADGNSDWEILQENNNAIRRRLERVIARPQRLPLDGTLDSPGSNLSSLEATPRIDAVLQWRHAPATDPLPALGLGKNLRPLQ